MVLFVLALLAVLGHRVCNRNAGKGANLHNLYSYAIQALFLILPTISRRICQSLQTCTSYDDGDYRFLAADHTIDCATRKHRFMTVYAFVMVLLVSYLGGGSFVLRTGGSRHVLHVSFRSPSPSPRPSIPHRP